MLFPPRFSRFALATALTLGLAIPLAAQEANTRGPSGDGVDNALLYAVAWKQTAAEYRALYYQGYNIARMRVEQALANRKEGDKPLAVFSDMDDTVLLPLPFWGHLILQKKDFFDDVVWDKWVPQNEIAAAPGAMEFFTFCKENGVEVFYITSRDQGEGTYEMALTHLRTLGLPFADAAHLTVLTDTSNKQKRQDELMETYQAVVFLGDNLNDFRRKYYLKGDIDGRLAKMEEDRALYGDSYILFPNPTDGHWLAAIFGESEPPASDANRKILLDAATRSAWQPK